jgi:hypothetical protein
MMALSDKDKKGLLLIGLVVAALGIIFGARFMKSGGAKAGPDGCIGTPVTNTVFVLDHSEAVAEQTRREITARALKHVDDLPQNERVTVFYVSELSKKKLVPAFSRCKPAAKGNRLYESVKGIEKTFQKTFLDPLQTALDVVPPDDKESPVAQALIDVSLTQYLRGQKSSLVVFSDMLENTPKFSIYRCSDPGSAIAAFRASRKGAQERPVFKNTAVSLNIIPRLETPKRALVCRDKLWPWFFGDNEGGSARVGTEYLPGG